MQGQTIKLPLVEIRLYDNSGNDIPLDENSQLIFKLKRQVAQVNKRPKRSLATTTTCTKWSPSISVYNSSSDVRTLAQCIVLTGTTRGLQNTSINSTDQAVRIDFSFTGNVSYVVRLGIGAPPTPKLYNATVLVINSTDFTMDNTTNVQVTLSDRTLGLFLEPGTAEANLYTTIELESRLHVCFFNDYI